ncbi:MAG: insulinase family protein [Proteobacteria bacterium]|nr:insulinase family protein [Pseudomonadota bacterium]MBS0494813.1 insulinase family protein [Pseudomonadota bacterium]
MNIKKIAARALLISVGAVFFISNAWALLPIQHWTEASGAQVWLVHSPAIPMVDVQVDFDAGSRRDPAPQAGLAAAVALMSSKGVTAGAGNEPALDENDLGEAWADLGANFGAQAGRDVFQYALRSLTEPDLLQQAAALAARQIAQPSLPAAVWASERARWSAAIKESYTRPGPVAARAFGTAVYGDNPYGQRPSEDTLARVEVADLQGFHDRMVAACRARVSIVGALDRAQAQALVRALLARLPERSGADCAALPAVPDAQPLQKAVQVDIPFAAAQAQVLIGQLGIARRDPDFLALLVGNHILGGGGFTSRLTQEVREKRGLSYSVYSDFSPGLNRGAFIVGLQTRPDQAAQALRVAQDTLARYVADGPTEAELRAAKDNLVGGFALRIDSNRKLLANVANIAWNDLPLDYLEHWTERVNALTLAEVRAAMQRHLQPDRMATVVVGGQP